MNVNQLMARIHTEMTGDKEKDIRHLQDIATDLRREENAVELLEALTEYAFNMMPDSAKEQMIEKTFVDGKRMDQIFGEALELVNAGNTAEAEKKLAALSDKIAEQYEDKDPKWVSFRNPFEYHTYRMLHPEDKELAQSLSGIDTNSSFDKLSKMEEKITRKEAEAAAFSEILGNGKPEEVATFEELERNAKVDSELERLMAEMGMAPSAADTGSVNDELAAAISALEADSAPAEMPMEAPGI